MTGTEPGRNTVCLASGHARVRLRCSLRRFWHPVCTLPELTAAGGPLPVELCGEAPSSWSTWARGRWRCSDRCPHRSTRLSLGWVDGRCAAVRLPRLAAGAPVGSASRSRRCRTGRVPGSAGCRPTTSRSAIDLVWVRLEERLGRPRCRRARPSTTRRLRAGHRRPYAWPVSVERRVENFTDLAHFAWVHDGSLGDRRHPGGAGPADPAGATARCASRTLPHPAAGGPRPDRAARPQPDYTSPAAGDGEHRVRRGRRRPPDALDDGLAAGRRAVPDVLVHLPHATTSTADDESAPGVPAPRPGRGRAGHRRPGSRRASRGPGTTARWSVKARRRVDRLPPVPAGRGLRRHASVSGRGAAAIGRRRPG